MTSKVDRPSEVGEYDPVMQRLPQLLEGSSLAGCSVPDIGCGLGAVDELLLMRHGARSVLGVDVDPALLSVMAVRIERAGLAGRLSTLCVGTGPLPLPDESFDVVFSKDAIVQI